MDKPFTPATLAERWGCSPDAVYDLIRSGKLPAFRVGAKLLRIQATEKIYSKPSVEVLRPAANVLDMKIKRRST